MKQLKTKQNKNQKRTKKRDLFDLISLQIFQATIVTIIVTIVAWKICKEIKSSYHQHQNPVNLRRKAGQKDNNSINN